MRDRERITSFVLTQVFPLSLLSLFIAFYSIGEGGFPSIHVYSASRIADGMRPEATRQGLFTRFQGACMCSIASQRA